MAWDDRTRANLLKHDQLGARRNAHPLLVDFDGDIKCHINLALTEK